MSGVVNRRATAMPFGRCEMLKRVIFPGLLGGLVMIVWAFVVNGVFGFKVSIDMNEIPGERQVYQVLKEHVTLPGRYICNPELTPSGTFPGNEPVFSVLYGGVGHEAAGMLALIKLPIFIMGPILAAWMLSVTSGRILSSYQRKVLFIVTIGLLFGVSGRLMSFGIGDYPVGSAAILAIHDIVVWFLVGLVLAWRIRPDSRPSSEP